MELNCIGRDRRVGRRLRDAVEFVTVARGFRVSSACGRSLSQRFKGKSG